MLSSGELEQLRREALEELVAATWASAPEAHRRELVRLVRRIDRKLERAGETDEYRLRRRLEVASAAGFSARGTLLRRPGGGVRTVTRGVSPPPRISAGGP